MKRLEKILTQRTQRTQSYNKKAEHSVLIAGCCEQNAECRKLKSENRPISHPVNARTGALCKQSERTSRSPFSVSSRTAKSIILATNEIPTVASLPLNDVERGETRGATLIQFALVFPILFFLIIAIIDLGRIFTVKSFLSNGANKAVALAARIPNFDIDIKGLDTLNTDYQRYRQARELIANEAVRAATGTMISSSNDNSTSTKLIPFTYLNPDDDSNASEQSFDVAILRPGESVKNNTDNVFLQHKTFSVSNDGLPPPQDPKVTLQYEPIMVELNAELDLFNPFISSIRLSSVAFGYREPSIPLGPLAMALTPEVPDPSGGPPGGGNEPPYGYNPTPTPTPACVVDWNRCFLESNGYPKTKCSDRTLPEQGGSGKCHCDNNVC